MEANKFAAILPTIIGSLTNKIIEETGLEEDAAFEKLYNSKLYAAIENDETKVWTFSIPKLYELYQTEQTTGELDFPEY
jgi:hypothetical protein